MVMDSIHSKLLDVSYDSYLKCFKHNFRKPSVADYICMCSLLLDMFNMTKLHKDIAMHLLECVDDQDFTDQATVKVSNDSSLCTPSLHMGTPLHYL